MTPTPFSTLPLCRPERSYSRNKTKTKIFAKRGPTMDHLEQPGVDNQGIHFRREGALRWIRATGLILIVFELIHVTGRVMVFEPTLRWFFDSVPDLALLDASNIVESRSKVVDYWLLCFRDLASFDGRLCLLEASPCRSPGRAAIHRSQVVDFSNCTSDRMPWDHFDMAILSKYQRVLPNGRQITIPI